MGSAFTPVQPRGPSGPKPTRRPSKRLRQASSLQHMALAQVPEMEADENAAPDHLSTSASEASSRGSNGSQPPLLDFIGGACNASAWFTSCFPCAVVDINDGDEYVMDKLSRESAMNVMYAANAQQGTPDSGLVRSKGSDQDNNNTLYVQLPSQPEPLMHPLAPPQTMPSAIAEEKDEEMEERMDEISLDDDDAPSVVTEDSGIATGHSGVRAPIYKPPKKGKFSVKKMFGKSKKTKVGAQ